MVPKWRMVPSAGLTWESQRDRDQSRDRSNSKTSDRGSQTSSEITRDGELSEFRDKIGWEERRKRGERGERPYQGSVCNRAYAIFEFSVEEVAEALVLRQVLDLNLFQVATEGFRIKSKTKRSEPNRQFERVDVSPQP